MPFCHQRRPDFLRLAVGDLQRRKDEQHARYEKHPEPERQGEDHQQLHDLRQRYAPRRVQAVADGDACQRGIEVVAERIGGSSAAKATRRSEIGTSAKRNAR